ncbi:hypothetical protein [Luteolibacter sp. AS25]|uniref:hypothetical protein n=1 Tax=Luteolibacter sp. AS25 TaxID=3135776 RepID=UPI00398A7CDC
MKVDISIGGLGDVWMRLAAFYSAVALTSDEKLGVIVPAKVLDFAKYVFSDRLEISSEPDSSAIEFVTLGIKDLARPILSGKRFAAPYARAVIRDRKSESLKQKLNAKLYFLANELGLIQVAPWDAIDEYQGFLEVTTLNVFKGISKEEFYDQVALDFPKLREKLMADALPISEELTIPSHLAEKTIVFPTGTSRQFMPAWWAKKHMPEAVFAFFFKDPDIKEFLEAGLETVHFYTEPGDVVALAKSARWAVSTDSFPSHLLQFSITNATILLTELARKRIVSPCFTGRVVESMAPCHPCLKMARGSEPLCQAGYVDCLNWSNPVYSSEACLQG